MPIRLLDQDVVTKIAAGEVVERPASVVKELVENSIDAGASAISVEEHNGGLTLIRVTDNGHGIEESEVELAFRRHATSKLQSLDDLEHLRSLGFRGEALPSIAAVADVEMVTATSDARAGTTLRLKNGVPSERRPEAHPQGTTISVHRLFHATPVRLKFLKSTRAESSRIAYLVSQFALSYPEIRFTLSIDGRVTLRTTGDADLRQAVAQVYGGEVAGRMLVLSQGPNSGGKVSTFPEIKVSGLTSPPDLNRASRSFISIFLNRRCVYDRMVSRAIDEAYRGLLMTDRCPIVVLNISLPPEMVDVNVHPTKHEVRFRQEGMVFAAVNAAISRALDDAAPAKISPHKTQRGAGSEEQQPLEGAVTSEIPFPEAPALSPAAQSRTPSVTAPDGPDFMKVLGQVDKTYIAAGAQDGLYLVDQHAAHERILFERFKQQLAEKHVEKQGLLEPLIVEVTPEQEVALAERRDTMADLGFTIEPFGERTYLLRTVPAPLQDDNAAQALHELLTLADDKEGPDWPNRAAASLACHAAIKAGQVLEDREAHELLRQLQQTTQPRTCPHGRPTMVHLSSGDLRRHFGRQ
ncbi:MAG: DNA mismatch repair endonuclease MutL [Chloroflexi bacterium]|nr:DNA mismatch repair endonuclease MutL [Chloroflexota bacterium]